MSWKCLWNVGVIYKAMSIGFYVMSLIQKEMKSLTNELKLSNKSKEFLDNLRIYLFSSGKKSDEIDDIVEELEIHLHEAERNGKPIEKVIGKTPEAYMEMISDEMMIDYRTWIDRKSTRLNSSHVAISYAVFCVKKKKQ